ncbi:hypothetical protein LTR37_003331 [Vermiconidia calcicola]|uniref:Uncharacterized protein n=1 Tax=Vermiconidia calcicola TaxID=1690605 RepID=A0ACC3NQM9_9PEZI|nr:hypothetical protein LTR37_003331 [Vermiconidia calcicola]
MTDTDRVESSRQQHMIRIIAEDSYHREDNQNRAILDKVTAGLISERLVKIVVGQEATPYYVQESVLRDAAAYFAKAIQWDHLSHETLGILKFPEDDEDAWKVLLQWFVKKELPVLKMNQATQMLWVRSWIIGDKYGIEAFQDLVMLELLNELAYQKTSLEVVRTVFEGTMEESPMRKLMAEETVNLIKTTEDWCHKRLELMDGVSGFTSALLEAMDNHDTLLDGSEDTTSLRKRMTDGESTNMDWLGYMLGNGPDRHRIYID